MTGPFARRLLALALVVGVATDILFRGNALAMNVAHRPSPSCSSRAR